jgi:hypothetical protein
MESENLWQEPFKALNHEISMHGACIMPTHHNPTPLKKKLKLSTNKNAPNQCFFLFGEYSHCNGNQNKNPVPSVQRPFRGRKNPQKLQYFEGKKKSELTIF